MKFILWIVFLMPSLLLAQAVPESGGISKDGFSSIMVGIISALAVYWVVLKYSGSSNQNGENGSGSNGNRESDEDFRN